MVERRRPAGAKVLTNFSWVRAEVDLVRKADDLHPFLHRRTAGDNGFFLITISQPYLAVKALAIPAKSPYEMFSIARN